MKHTLIPVANHGITLSEVPGKTSLFIEVGLCRIHCRGCHSPHLTCKTCDLYTDEQVERLIDSYRKKYPVISTVVFMGGLHNTGVDRDTFRSLIERIHLPVAVYSGQDEDLEELLAWKNLQYIKTGSYVAKLGGLEENTSNQHFYEKHKTMVFDRFCCYDHTEYWWEDKTHLFRKRKEDTVAQYPNKRTNTN